MLAQGYVCVASPLGNVYYLPDGVVVDGDISINYMEYPWITCFEVSGLAISRSCMIRKDPGNQIRGSITWMRKRSLYWLPS